jgi:hypothetical protein
MRITQEDPAMADEPANPDEAGSADATPPLNREQRRAQKFHRHAAARQDNLQTQRQNNTGFLSGTPNTIPEDADPSLETSSTAGSENHGGPGTGGETETAGRAAHHEGIHEGNPGKS